ncbi:MAG: antitoxin [Acidimicrobiia bacterium]
MNAALTAPDSGKTMSEVITELIRSGLHKQQQPTQKGVRGLPVVSVGRTITAEDVRNLADE